MQRGTVLVRDTDAYAYVPIATCVQAPLEL